MKLLETDPIPEGTAGEVCIILESENSESLGFNVVAELTVDGGTAGTYECRVYAAIDASCCNFTVNQDDFVSPPMQLVTFSTESLIGSSKCFTVSTNVDDVFEGEESFVVSVVSVNGDPSDTVLISAPRSTNILILDSTG